MIPRRVVFLVAVITVIVCNYTILNYVYSWDSVEIVKDSALLIQSHDTSYYWHKIKPFHFNDRIITGVYFDVRETAPRLWIFGFRNCQSEDGLKPIYVRFREDGGHFGMDDGVEIKVDQVCRSKWSPDCKWNDFMSSTELNSSAISSTNLYRSLQISTDPNFSSPNKIVDVPTRTVQRPSATMPYRYKFALCIQPVYYYSDLYAFIQFVEIWKLLGAEFFYFYAVSVSNDIHDLLRAYKKQGILEIVPWPLLPVDPKGSNPNAEIYRYGMNLAMNDCIYRNSGQVEFLGMFDLDEFLIPFPKKGKPFDRNSLVPTIQKALNKEQSGVLAIDPVKVDYDRNHKFQMLDKIYGYNFNFDYLRKLKITEGFSGNQKLLVKPDKVLQASAHYIIKFAPNTSQVHLSYSRPKDDPKSELMDQSLRLYHLRRVPANWGQKNRTYAQEKYLKTIASQINFKFKSFLQSNFESKRVWDSGSKSLQKMLMCVGQWRKVGCKAPTTNCKHLKATKHLFVNYDSSDKSVFYVLPS